MGERMTGMGRETIGLAWCLLALRHPELVSRLCVVDISPVDYGSSDEFQQKSERF